MLSLNALTEMTYETLRKGKMYLKNDRTIIIDVPDLLELLKGISVNYFQIRFFFTRFTTDTTTDLLANYPEKLLVATLTYSLVRNYPLTIKTLFSDSNTYIFDILCESDDQTIREIFQDILQHKATSFVSKVEIRTKGEEEELHFCLEGLNKCTYSDSLFTHQDTVDVLSPLQLKLPIDLELLDKYYLLLNLNYNDFYQDVANRPCAVWCYREGSGEYLVKRNIMGKQIIFPDTYDKAAPLLDLEKIIQIVPNSIPNNSPCPIEIIVDLDTGSVTYPLVKTVSDRLSQWLIDRDFLYYRRLTGSLNAGSHWIFPVKWEEAYLLAGSDSTWDVYKQRAPTHILCDSARTVAELLCLVFQKDNPDLAKFITTRIFDPYSRHGRILWDITSNSMHRGRRSIASLHHKYLTLCIPLDRDIPPTREELEDLVSLDEALKGDIVFSESPRTTHMQKHNTKLLREIIDQEERLYHDYFLMPRARFEEMHFGIPVK